MSLHVQTQVITPSKSSVTKMTFEGFAAGVFAVMPGEFVRSGKLPVTSLPAAQVRLLPGVGPLVGLQVTALGVNLQRGLYNSDGFKRERRIKCNAMMLPNEIYGCARKISNRAGI